MAVKLAPLNIISATTLTYKGTREADIYRVGPLAAYIKKIAQ
jgi:hypothetical protein